MEEKAVSNLGVFCIVLSILLSSRLGTGAIIQPEQSVVTVYPCSRPPLIDGSLEDTCWSECVPLHNFTVLTGAAPSQYPTTARVTYDKTNLYLSAVCMADRPPLSDQTDHDHPDLWRDDHIEVFIKPDPGSRTYYHLQINTNGAWLDQRVTGYEPRDPSWDIELDVAVATRSDGYTMEVAIPFDGLGTAPQPAAAVQPETAVRWGFNVCRGTYRAGELSAWSRLAGTFFAPDRFGAVVFGARGPRLLEIDSLPTFPGSHVLSMLFVPTAEQELGVRVQTRVERREGSDLATEQTIRIFTPQPYRSELPLVVPEDARSIVLDVLEIPSKRLIYSTGPFPLAHRPPPVFEADALLAALDVLESASNVPAVRRTLERGRKVVQQARKIQALRDAYFASLSPSPDQWRDLAETAQNLARDVRRALIIAQTCKADVESGRRPSDYAILVLSPMTKIERTATPDGIVDGTVTIELARGEYESAQFTLWPFEHDLEEVSITVSDLLHTARKGVILSRDILVHRVGFVDCRPPQYEPDLEGSVPDPLLPYEPFSVPAGTHQPVWLTVHVSRAHPAGLYEGSIVVSAQGQPPRAVPMTVRVYDFLLEKIHLKTAFALFESEVKDWYELEGDRPPQDLRRKYYEFLLSYRLNPTNIYASEPRPSKEDLDFCLERGMNAFSVKHIPRGIEWTEDQKKKVLDFFDEYYPYLKEKNLLDVAYCYSFDEPGPDHYPKIREIFGLLGLRYPGLRRATTEPPNPELEGYVDIYVPLTADYDEETCRARQEARDEIWWYVCLVPKHPYANFFIDYQGIDHRILFWQTWKYRVTGFLYYAINLWRSNLAVEPTSNIVPFDDPDLIAKIRSGLRWPEIPWNSYTYTRHNGDGHLIYPGIDGRLLPSIRLALIRDGVEDYEYHYLLKSRLDALLAKKSISPEVVRLTDAASKALAIPREVVESLTSYTHDPAVLMEQRRRVAQLIEKIDRKLEELE